jgi:hypothetical protein
MFSKILTYSVVAILAVALIGGTVFILTRPDDASAYSPMGTNRENGTGGNGNSDGNSNGSSDRGNSGTTGGGQGSGNAGGGNSGGNSGGGRGLTSENNNAPSDWDTITGVVLISDSELTIDTAAGEIIVGLGQSSYRDEQEFVVNVGDEVRVQGYMEDGEFKAGVIENLTLGTSIVLRDEGGRPLWSGGANRNSQFDEGQTDTTGGNGYGGGRGQNQQDASSDVSSTVLETANVEELSCPICDEVTDYSGVLSEEEINALYLALNDEYHAWAVYEQVISDFGSVRPFTSIQKAEENHIAALTGLLEYYEVPVPENTWIGQVASFEDIAAACSAGVDAEIANGALYDTLFSSTERDDILQVYTSLQRASLEQHLPAFSRCAE